MAVSEKGNGVARVFLVEDHPVVQKGLQHLLEEEAGFSICGVAESVPNALKQMSEDEPDVAVVDISLPGRSGLELVQEIRKRFPSVAVLVVSVHDESLYAERALRAGASGYLMKQESIDDVVEAVQTVLEGEIYVSDAVSARMMRRVRGGASPEESPMETLSNRELQVFERIGKGKATKEIAKELCLSVKTIETYRQHIKEKLYLENATELLRHAVHWVHEEASA